MTEDEFNKLKRQVDAESKELARCEGQYDQLLQRAKSDYGCKSAEELETLLSKEQKLESRLQREYDKARKEWDDRWLTKLESI